MERAAEGGHVFDDDTTIIRGAGRAAGGRAGADA
jgi:hypothetical protein